MTEQTPRQLFAMQLPAFAQGTRLEVAHGSFRGVGFGGRGTITRFTPEQFELDVRVTKLLFHIDVRLQFQLQPEGKVSFVGGRPDGKKTGTEPAQVRHSMTVKSQTAERTVFEFALEEKGAQVTRQVAVEKTKANGADALRISYDRYEMTLVPSRRAS